jgi:hypothetical protein
MHAGPPFGAAPFFCAGAVFPGDFGLAHDCGRIPGPMRRAHVPLLPSSNPVFHAPFCEAISLAPGLGS